MDKSILATAVSSSIFLEVSEDVAEQDSAKEKEPEIDPDYGLIETPIWKYSQIVSKKLLSDQQSFEGNSLILTLTTLP